MTGWQKSSRRILIAFTIVYCLFCGCIWMLQRRLLYFPTKISADAVVRAGAERGLAPWKNSSGEIIGWKIPASGTAVGSVLVIHGNAGCAIERDYIAQPIHAAAAVDVFILEYPGYGARAGSPSKKSFDAAAEEAFQIMPASLAKYVVSESIGTGAACYLAKVHPSEVAGMTLLVPYHNLASVAQRQMWFLPAYFLLLDRFNPEDCLKNYHGPVKFVVAGADEIISPKSGQRLANGYGGPKEIQLFAGAHHNEISGQSANWWREVFAFWKLHQPHP